MTKAEEQNPNTPSSFIQVSLQKRNSNDNNNNKGKGKGKVHPRRGHENPEKSRGIAVLFL